MHNYVTYSVEAQTPTLYVCQLVGPEVTSIIKVISHSSYIHTAICDDCVFKPRDVTIYREVPCHVFY